jgi:lysozyme family protein
MHLKSVPSCSTPASTWVRRWPPPFSSALNALNRGARDYADIAVDGAVGPATLAALAGFLRTRAPAGETVLLKALEALQGERYLHLAETRPANEAFLYGWLANRMG